MAQLHAEPHGYGVLADLNTRPRARYLAALTNPNPELAAARMHDGHAEEGVDRAAGRAAGSEHGTQQREALSDREARRSRTPDVWLNPFTSWIAADRRSSRLRRTRAASIAQVMEPGHGFTSVTDKISQIVLRPGILPGWLFGFMIAFAVMMMFLYAVTYLVFTGTGIWGVNIPVGWGFDIVNFVWWIGIGHAGTLISAILLLFRQRWRMSIARFAEAMTLFAVACAGMFPVLHTGRPWLAYWLFPYPNSMGLWPQFRSPLIWDVFAVSTYADGVGALLVRRASSPTWRRCGTRRSRFS